MKNKLHFEFDIECGEVEQTMLDQAPQLYEMALRHMLDLGFQRKISGLVISSATRSVSPQSTPNQSFGNPEQLKEQYALASQWISVNEHLPNKHEEVLVYLIEPGCIAGENAVAYYDGEGWHTTHGRHIRPIYWMSIPKLSSAN